MVESPTEHYRTLMGIARGYQCSQALAVAADLGIADLLKAGPRASDDLATPQVPIAVRCTGC